MYVYGQRTHYVAKDDREFLIFMSLAPECWALICHYDQFPQCWGSTPGHSLYIGKCSQPIYFWQFWDHTWGFMNIRQVLYHWAVSSAQILIFFGGGGGNICTRVHVGGDQKSVSGYTLLLQLLSSFFETAFLWNWSSLNGLDWLAGQGSCHLLHQCWD